MATCTRPPGWSGSTRMPRASRRLVHRWLQQPKGAKARPLSGKRGDEGAEALSRRQVQGEPRLWAVPGLSERQVQQHDPRDLLHRVDDVRKHTAKGGLERAAVSAFDTAVAVLLDNAAKKNGVSLEMPTGHAAWLLPSIVKAFGTVDEPKRGYHFCTIFDAKGVTKPKGKSAGVTVVCSYPELAGECVMREKETKAFMSCLDPLWWRASKESTPAA